MGRCTSTITATITAVLGTVRSGRIVVTTRDHAMRLLDAARDLLRNTGYLPVGCPVVGVRRWSARDARAAARYQRFERSALRPAASVRCAKPARSPEDSKS